MSTSTRTVHRPVRAYPPPLPAAELTIAAPPALDRAVPGAAGWLQCLVPLVGSGGSMAFLFAFPGPRPAWLVALVVGAAPGLGGGGARGAGGPAPARPPPPGA